MAVVPVGVKLWQILFVVNLALLIYILRKHSTISHKRWHVYMIQHYTHVDSWYSWELYLLNGVMKNVIASEKEEGRVIQCRITQKHNIQLFVYGRRSEWNQFWTKYNNTILSPQLMLMLQTTLVHWYGDLLSIDTADETVQRTG